MLTNRERLLILTAATAMPLACVDRPATAPTLTNTAATRQAGPRSKPFTPYTKVTQNPYTDRFLTMWNEIHDPKNGYFSADGIPYHSLETLIVEAPDYGHETTSEAYSYWIWLESLYGRVTSDWSQLEEAWANLEAYAIPSPADQPTTAGYDPSKPSTYSAQREDPKDYPSPLAEVAVGADPIAGELRATYGDSNVYAMHWLLDVDNWYGFGRRGDGTSSPSYFNTFQRGPHESVWETVPQPSWDEMKWGGTHGYLDLYIAGSDTPQWKYTAAPDADARAVQAVYWARRWAGESGKGSAVAGVVQKAAKLGDYLRYALFDKYFKSIGCKSLDCPPGRGRGAAHYLLSWYFAWGGSVPSGGDWAWRIASSDAHQGYQNPMAAYALGTTTDMRPRSPSAWGDWARSLVRQLEMYRFLQSNEGAIAGGVTNSWRGVYGAPPAGTPTFYGMAYDASPVFLDPPSNDWFGFQAWSMERLAEYYYVTADARAEVVLSKWVKWVIGVTSITDDGFAVPSTLHWSGQPSASWDEKHAAFDGNDARFNAGLHVTVKDTAADPGTGASVAKALAFWAARSGDTNARLLAKNLLDRIWTKDHDAKGIFSEESRKDYKRFNEPLPLPRGWTGTMPNGDKIDATSTFLSIRSKYKSDPDWPRVQAYLRGGEPPKIAYHRFWVEAEVATAFGVYGWLFPEVAAAKR